MAELKQELKIRNTVLANRLVMPPMATGKSDDGIVSGQLLDYYEEKSMGGYIGLIIIEHEYISDNGRASVNQLSVAHDDTVEGLAELAKVIHDNGSKVLLQINHAGGKADPVCGEIMAPSAVPYKRRNSDPVIPEEMDETDINNVINDFVQAAIRAEKAGYDGVELHSAHGYLLNQFYSPLTNKRTDAYTGSTLEGRILLHTQVLKAVRKAVREDFIVAVRLGAVDDAEGGTTAEDSVKAAQILEASGADLLDISGGTTGYIRPHIKTPGYFRKESAMIKAAVQIPVITAGGIVTKEQAEELLESGDCDLVGVARAILADSSWARHAFKPSDEEIMEMMKKHPGNQEEYHLEHVSEAGGSPLKGKHICYLGSSVTFGAASFGVSFADYIGKRTGCTFVKEAVSGTTLTALREKNYIERMEQNLSKDEKFDAFVCQLSTNDATAGFPLGEISTDGNFNTKEVTGAMEFIINYAKRTWDCPVFFYTGTKFYNKRYQKMVERLYELKEKWDIKVIDLWNNDMNDISREDYDRYMADPIHPTQAGYLEWWTPEIEKQLVEQLD